MEYTDIKILTDKYFLSETSVEEEKQLKAYFSSNEVEPELQALKPFFCALEENNIAIPGKNFDEKILSLIEEEEKVVHKAKLRPLLPTWTKIAAAAIILLLLTVLMKQYVFKKTSDKDNNIIAINNKVVPAGIAEIKDTYDDPEQARAELEKALALISDKMNKGKAISERPISKLNVIDKIIETSN